MGVERNTGYDENILEFIKGLILIVINVWGHGRGHQISSLTLGMNFS